MNKEENHDAYAVMMAMEAITTLEKRNYSKDVEYLLSHGFTATGEGGQHYVCRGVPFDHMTLSIETYKISGMWWGGVTKDIHDLTRKYEQFVDEVMRGSGKVSEIWTMGNSNGGVPTRAFALCKWMDMEFSTLSVSDKHSWDMLPSLLTRVVKVIDEFKSLILSHGGQYWNGRCYQFKTQK